MHKLLSALFENVIEAHIVLKIQAHLTNDCMEGCYSRYRLPSKSKILEDTIHLYRRQGLGVVNNINAKEYAHKCLNPEDELLVLAHEFGHFFSYKDGNWPEIYKEMLEKDRKDWSQQSLQHREAVLNEEKLAWDYAEKILYIIGLTNWAAFDAKRIEALSVYCTNLDISDQHGFCKNSLISMKYPFWKHPSIDFSNSAKNESSDPAL